MYRSMTDCEIFEGISSDPEAIRTAREWVSRFDTEYLQEYYWTLRLYIEERTPRWGKVSEDFLRLVHIVEDEMLDRLWGLSESSIIFELSEYTDMDLKMELNNTFVDLMCIPNDQGAYMACDMAFQALDEELRYRMNKLVWIPNGA
jgi:hypothetical protein